MFSELIDNVMSRSGRMDTKSKINCIGYARQIMRECQIQQNFERDLTEDQLTATSDPFVWNKPLHFRRMRTVLYPPVTYPMFILPGKRQHEELYYYYSATTYFVFKGCGEDNAAIDIAYYSYFRRYQYYSEGARPAVFNSETETWTYLDNGSYVGTLGSDALDEAARAKVSNWLLEDWNDLIFEGTLAKLLTAIDDARAPKIYRSYLDQRDTLVNSEPYQSLDF